MRRGLARSAWWRTAIVAVRHPHLPWKDGMGITAWKDDMGIGTGAPDVRCVRERLSASERDALRQRISTAVRERESTDAEAWKEIKANGRPASRQRP